MHFCHTVYQRRYYFVFKTLYTVIKRVLYKYRHNIMGTRSIGGNTPKNCTSPYKSHVLVHSYALERSAFFLGLNLTLSKLRTLKTANSFVSNI